MKKLAYKLILLAIVIIGYNSCQENQTIDNNQERLSANEFEFIGIEHNKILSNLYNDLEGKKNSGVDIKIKHIEDVLVDEIMHNEYTTKDIEKQSVENIKEALYSYESKLSKYTRL